MELDFREILDYRKKTYRFKSFQELIDYIDGGWKSKKIVGRAKFIGNEIDVVKLIKRYHFDNIKELNDKNWYGEFRDWLMPTINECRIGPLGMYGNRITKFDINGINVEIHYSPKSNYENSYSSNLVEDLTSTDEYVLLDIETTGLNAIMDDIIQICIYNNRDDYYEKYLPLEQRDENLAIEVNRISNELLKDAVPLTQQDVDDLIKRFDLENKTVVIWTSNNLFDRTFLEVYFLKHGLKGLEKIKFFNGRKLIDKFDGLHINYASKDTIAILYDIDIEGAHNALADCMIEHEIVKKLLNGEIEPLRDAYKYMVDEIKGYLLYGDYEDKILAEKLYDKFCKILPMYNGAVKQDYNEHHITRGGEWIDIHHIDEKSVSNVSNKETWVFLGLEDYLLLNQKSRLVFATKVEHFLLHSLTDIINGIDNGGTHATFGSLLKMKIGIFEENSKEYQIQQRNDEFYKKITFDEVLRIYERHNRLMKVSLTSAIDLLYHLEEYKHDEDKLRDIILRVSN